MKTNIGITRIDHDMPKVDVLKVSDLTVRLKQDSSVPPVLNQIGFTLKAGEILGILGESGAGKTTLAMALTGLLPGWRWQVAGDIAIAASTAKSSTKPPRPPIALIHQDSGVLNPVIRIGHQIVEVAHARGIEDWSACRELARDLLRAVGFDDYEAIYLRYPHQLSGGERQRVVIAQALASDPVVLIADEPTASLDYKTAKEVRDLLVKLVVQAKIGLILISHDVRQLAKTCDRLLVLYAGEVMEVGATDEVLSHPCHPYSQALLRCLLLPDFSSQADRKPLLPYIPGRIDSSAERNCHCTFENRCDERMQICRQSHPVPVHITESHQVSCFRF